MSKFAVYKSKARAAFDGAFDDSARERVFEAPRVVDCGHARSNLESIGKPFKRIASRKKVDFYYRLSHVAIGGAGKEAVLTEHVWVEFGDGDHCRKVIV